MAWMSTCLRVFLSSFSYLCEAQTFHVVGFKIVEKANIFNFNAKFSCRCNFK